MSVFSIYVISESGSLQYSYDHAIPLVEVEKSYNYPLPFTFKMHDGYLIVDFGAKDEIKIGYAVLSINGIPAKGAILEDGREILQLFADQSQFPMTLKLGRPKLRPNDRINLASMFQPLHQMARFLSPVGLSGSGVAGSNHSGSGPGNKASSGLLSTATSVGGQSTTSSATTTSATGSPLASRMADSLASLDPGRQKGNTGVWASGILSLETATCRIHCLEAKTGVKFLLITDVRLPPSAREALRRVYEAYADYVLKNPFYAPNQPFNFEFFSFQVKLICEQIERGNYFAAST